jgi:hypothetical protein
MTVMTADYVMLSPKSKATPCVGVALKLSMLKGTSECDEQKGPQKIGSTVGANIK